MTDYRITRGDGWNVFLASDRLFIVETSTGTRRADFAVDAKLLSTLRQALTSVAESDSTPMEEPKKKTTRKKTTK